MKIKNVRYQLLILVFSVLSIACLTGGPSDETAKEDAKKHIKEHGGTYMFGDMGAFDVSVVGRESQDSKVIIQLDGKTSFTGKLLGGAPWTESFSFQLELVYKKFGDKWQFDGERSFNKYNHILDGKKGN